MVRFIYLIIAIIIRTRFRLSYVRFRELPIIVRADCQNFAELFLAEASQKVSPELEVSPEY